MSNEEIVKRIKSGEPLMLDLYHQNKGLLYSVAVKYTWGAELEDLLQTAFIGLTRAVYSFDDKKGADFSSHAYMTIKGTLQRYVETSGAVHVPIYRQAQANKLRKLTETALKEQGRKLTDREARTLLGVDQDALEDIKKASITPVSLSTPTGEGVELADTIASEDPAEGVIDKVEREQLRDTVNEEIKKLPKKDREIIKKRYWKRQTFKQMGKGSKTIHDRAIRKLNRSKNLKDFVSYGDALKNSGVKEFQRTWTSSTEREALRGK